MSKIFSHISSGISNQGLSSDPSDPQNGDLYYNTTSNVFRQYINGAWHNVGSEDVTLTAVGSSPNSSAASISGQTLTLQPADGSNPGVISTGTQTLAGNKTFSGIISASNFSGSSSGTNTGDVTLTAFGSSPSSSAATISGQILTLQPADATNPGGVSTGSQTFGGTKTFANIIDSGLTASGAVYADGSKQLTSVALTNGQILIGSTGANPVANTITAGSGISITNGAGSTTVSMIVPSSSGDIATTSFTAADNQSSAADVTGFAFANGSVTGFDALVTIVRASTYATYKLLGIQKSGSWEMSQDYVGDITGITFSITTLGQIQYQSTSTGSTATIKFRAISN